MMSEQPTNQQPDAQPTQPPKPKRKRYPPSSRTGPTGWPASRVFKSAEKADEFFTALACGVSIDTACRIIGCDKKTIYNERDRNEEFAARLKEVRDTLKVDAFLKLKKYGNNSKDWRAFQAILQMMFPNEFGIRQPDTVTPQQLVAKLSAVGVAAAKAMSPEKAAQFNREMQAIIGDVLAGKSEALDADQSS